MNHQIRRWASPINSVRQERAAGNERESPWPVDLAAHANLAYVIFNAKTHGAEPHINAIVQRCSALFVVRRRGDGVSV
jgi:hypothetical protein